MASRDHTTQLLQDQAHTWNHIFSFINSMSLKSAIQPSIPDIVKNHGLPITLSELASALRIHPKKFRSLYRLMRILVHSCFFAKKELSSAVDEESYTLTSASQLLLKDHPLSVTPFLTAMLDPVITKPWDFLSTWFQNGAGMTIWDYGNSEPDIAHLLNDAMASDARLVASIVVDECKEVFEGLESLVDVGGGTGTVAKSIADAFPHIECTVLDLPHVVADLQGSKNLKYVGGNMFQEVPPGDAILLKAEYSGQYQKMKNMMHKLFSLIHKCSSLHASQHAIQPCMVA